MHKTTSLVLNYQTVVTKNSQLGWFDEYTTSSFTPIQRL